MSTRPRLRRATLDLLLPAPHDQGAPRWATVTQASPLRVQLDGETAPLPFTPDTLVGGLAVNDRVFVQLFTNADPARRARRVVILGRAGGPAALPNVQTFTTGGGTWTRPAGAKAVHVWGKGLGGAGGGAALNIAGESSMGAGGGEGEEASGWFDPAALAATVAVIVPAVATGASGAAGSAGGTLSFGAHLSAGGGSGGGVRATSPVAFGVTGAPGGTGGSGGSRRQAGAPGGHGWGQASLGISGAGGGKGGGPAIRTQTQPSSSPGNAATGIGGGGGGAITAGTGAAQPGGAGGAGYVEITTYF